MVGNAVWGQTTSTSGITISNEQTYNLENTTISVASNSFALTVNEGASATLNITGVCELISGDGSTPAALIPEGSALTITGTGILRIKGNENVQTVTGGKNNGKHGTITVASGTVYILGDLGHDGSGKHGIIQVQGGIAFVDGTIKGDENADNTAGILFQHNTTGNVWDGTLYSEKYEIKSNVSGDIDGDGSINDDAISLTVPSGHELSLGENVVIERNTNNNFTVTVETGGVFKYFAVSYDANAVPNCATTSVAPVDNNWYGRNTTINVSDQEMTCSGKADVNGVHKFLGWVKEGDTDLKVGITSITTPSDYTQSGRETTTFKAAWATEELNLTLTEGEAMNVRLLANQPKGVVSYTDISDEQSSLPSGIKFENGAFSGTPAEGTSYTNGGVYNVTVSYTYTDNNGSEQQGSATIKITVLSDAPSINNGTIKWADTNNGTYTYNNQQYKPITIEVNGESLIEGTHFTVKYNYTANESGTESKDENNNIIVKMAGTYTVESISPITGAAQGSEITNAKIEGSDITITVKKRTINGYVVPQSVEIDNGNVNTTPTVRQNNTGTIYVSEATTDKPNQGFATGENTVTDIFTGELSGVPNPLAVGTYTLSADNVDLKNSSDDVFLKNNYEKGTITGGTLTVTDALTDDDVNTEIKDEDGEDDNAPTEDEDGAWTITYDGKTHEITKVKKGEVEILATGTNGEANYTISYTYKATEEATEETEVDLNNGGAIKNVGIYTATIEFANGYEGTKTETIIIKPRDLTVDLNIPETIDPEQDLEDLSSWWDKDDITLTGIVDAEAEDAKENFANASVSIDGELTAGEPADVKVFNVKLEDNESFLTSNYTITYQNGETKPITDFSNLDSDENNTENDTTIDDGTTVGQIEINPGEGGDDITGGEDNSDPKDGDLADDEDFVMIHPEGEGSISVYDGKPHGLSLLVIKTQEGQTYTLHEGEDADYTVTYASQDGTKAVDTETGKPLHAGSYIATVTLNDDSQYKIKNSENNSFELTIQIAKRPMTVDLNIPTTIKSGQDLDNLSDWWSNKDITFENIVADEEDEARATLATAAAQITGPLPAAGEKVTVTATDVKLTTDSDPFFVDNYDITYKNGETTLTLTDTDSDSNNDDASIDDGTTVDDSDKIEIDPDDEGTDITGGENEDGEEGLDEDDYILVSTGNSDDVNAIYDGETHTIEYMVATVNGTTYYLTAGTDFTVGFNNSEEGLEEGKPHDAGTYKATIEMTGKYKGSFTLDVTIKPRPLTVYFNFPQEIADKANIEWNKNHITYNGLVNADEEDEETPMIPNGCRLEVRNNKVWLMNFALNDNVDTEFEKDNYVISYQGNTGDITVLINSAEEDIDEDGNPDTELPDGEIDLNPGDHDKPDGGNHGSGWDKPEYYNIYIDTVCPGLNVEVSRDVVKGGNEVSVYLTIQSECDTTGMRFEYKRGLFGRWEDLKLLEDVQPGEYVIKHIYTDIYIRALDATMPDDATGLEEVEGVKAYAQDGNIYVYTPNRMPVWIVSMTGAVLRNEEQVGLHAYDRLTRGIYIVRVGEQVFKIRL